MARQVKNLEDTTSHLTDDVASLRQQLDKQNEDNIRLIRALAETQAQITNLTESFRSLLATIAPAPSNP